MDTIPNKKIYDADIYLRLSKEDGDKVESYSISNQRELIREFLKSMPEIRVHKIRVDDGYSGVNFQRPAFQSMLKDMKEGKVNCVIVKDLSRLGRNYIEVGKYIEKIFPFLGVRFIAINDNYDSEKNANEQLIVAFKNLINDAYCRDISVKIRSNLEVKRKRGEFVGAFAPYGYKKDEKNKWKLVIDEETAPVVRTIFYQFMQGKSIYKIADYLNERGIPTPAEYKSGISKYYTGFNKNATSVWMHTTVLRILKNYAYTGAVVQGKETTPNYKVKKKIRKEENLWICVGHMQEPIVSHDEFYTVQKLLKIDTKTAANKDSLYPLAGLLKCGDCGGNMSRKTIPSSNKKNVYYVCGNNKYNKQCSSHTMNAKRLEKSILDILNNQLEQVVCINDLRKRMELISYRKREVENRSKQIIVKREEMKRYKELKLHLYEDYQEHLLTKEEYEEMKEEYQQRMDRLVRTVELIQEEINSIVTGSYITNEWMERFIENGKLSELTREVTVSLIDEVLVYDKVPGEKYCRLEIHFKYENEFRAVVNLMESIISEKEIVLPKQQECVYE